MRHGELIGTLSDGTRIVQDNDLTPDHYEDSGGEIRVNAADPATLLMIRDAIAQTNAAFPITPEPCDPVEDANFTKWAVETAHRLPDPEPCDPVEGQT